MWFQKLFRGAPALAARFGAVLGTGLLSVGLAGSVAFGESLEGLRVVSLSEDASAVLLGIGAREALVAVDEQSRVLDGLGSLPVATLSTVSELGPDLVVVPSLGGEAAPLAAELRDRGIELVEFAPHDFDDAFDLCRMLGVRLGRREQARAFVRERSRELARISSSSTGERRPRVAAVVELDPLVVAGGHSFVTDLIEIAGAENVTHGTHESRIPMGPAELLALRPEIVLVVRADEIPESQRAAVRATLRAVPRVVFLGFDPQRVWLGDAVGIAGELRVLVASRLDE